MTVQELIETLEALAEEVGDETEIRVAVNPAWPLRHELAEVTVVDGYVWLAASVGHPEGDDSPYAPHAAWTGGVASDEDAADLESAAR
jgi:hypothetical protein